AGQHAFYSGGGDWQYFDVAADGTITLENTIDGTVIGNTLTITGVAVSLDASALGTPLYLDGVLQDSPVITVNLLPGQHAFYSGGGDWQYFDVAADGTISLENTVVGTVAGNTLTLTGVAVNLDASALGTPLYLDGVLQDSPVITVNLLPGQHAFYS